MRIALLSFQKYAQKVTLYENLGETNIIKKYTVMWEDKEGLSEFPLLIARHGIWAHDAEILWDTPERVSKAIMPYVEKCMVARNALRFAEEYPGWHSYDKRDKVLIEMLFKLQEVKKVLVRESSNQFMII